MSLENTAGCHNKIDNSPDTNRDRKTAFCVICHIFRVSTARRSKLTRNMSDPEDVEDIWLLP